MIKILHLNDITRIQFHLIKEKAKHKKDGFGSGMSLLEGGQIKAADDARFYSTLYHYTYRSPMTISTICEDIKSKDAQGNNWGGLFVYNPKYNTRSEHLFFTNFQNII